jgi:hypothetical protein
MMRDPFGLEPDGFKNQLTDLEWQCGGEQEEASPIKAASEYSERVKKETIRANKIAWNPQMRDRDAADKIHLTLDVAGIFDPTPWSDLTNAGLYVSEGNYLAAGTSIVGVLPWIGDIFKSTRITAAMARLAERGAVKGGELFNFSSKAAEHMANPRRTVPVQILDQAIKSSKGIADPRGSRALMYTTKMYKNGKPYNLEVLYDNTTNTIWHFQYSNIIR